MNVRVTARPVVWTLVGALALVVLGFVAIGFRELFQAKDVSKMKPERLFYWLVCDRIPLSVTNLKAHGHIMFTGHSIRMDFEIAPADFEVLLKRGRFVPIEERHVSEDWFKMERKRASELEFYQKRGGEFDGIRTVIMQTTTNHDQVFIRYFGN